MKIVHVLNLGAGVQSTRLALEFDTGAILGADGIPVKLDVAYFADTQDEPEAVYKHVEWIKRTVTCYPITTVTKGRLSDHLMKGQNSTGQRFASIPAFTLRPDGDAGKVGRQCSSEYKIEPINRAIRQDLLGLKPRRAVPKDVQVIQYLGISAEEANRAVRVMRNAVPERWKKQSARWDYGRLMDFFRDRRWKFAFPLVDRFLTRAHCIEYNTPRVPHKVPRSACVYCPFHDDVEWAEVKKVPADWALSVALDTALRIPGNVVNRNLDQQLFLHRSCQPIGLVQLNLNPDPRKAQLAMNFSSECLGVCGV